MFDRKRLILKWLISIWTLVLSGAGGQQMANINGSDVSIPTSVSTLQSSVSSESHDESSASSGAMLLLTPIADNSEYLIVRGEASSQENLEFKLAATKLLQMQRDHEEQLAQNKQEVAECQERFQKATFSLYDYLVLLAMLAISLGIGIFYGFFKKSGNSSNEFLLGSEMSLFPVTLSLTTSFITAIELLGNPAEVYYHGTQFVLIVISIVLVVPVAVYVFYPIYFKMELTSCYEYLGIRFGKEIRIFGALLYVVQMCFYTAVAVLAPAIGLSKATGLNTIVAVILIYIVCVFYSSQGGMNAVVIADTFQAIVLAVSLVLIIGLGAVFSGTPADVFHKAFERQRLEFFNLNVDPTSRHTIFSVVIGGFFYWTSLFCTNQASVQKCMSLKSMKLAKIALAFAIFGLIVVFALNFYTGLMVFNHYSDCDPLSADYITGKDQLLPFYVINTYRNVYTIAGIYVAGIFAASLGTVASALNSLSAVTCEDLLVNGLNIKISPERGAAYAKWLSLGYGAISFVLVFIVERLGGVLQATLTLNGLVGGVTLGLFVLGIAFKCANTKGAFYGGIIALLLVIFIGVVAQIVNVEPDMLSLSITDCECSVQNNFINNSTNLQQMPLSSNTGFTSWAIFRLSYMWYSMLGCLLTITFGLLTSLMVSAIEERRIVRLKSVESDNLEAAGAIDTANAGTAAVTEITHPHLPTAIITIAGFKTNRKSNTQKPCCINQAITLDDE